MTPEGFTTSADGKELLRCVERDPRCLSMHGTSFQADFMPGVGKKDLRTQSLESRLVEDHAG